MYKNAFGGGFFVENVYESGVVKKRKAGEKRLFFNIACSVAEHGISALAVLFLTRLLINGLGIERYGLYPAVLEISSFFSIAFGVINSTSGRYIAIEEEQGNTDIASAYFSTAFFSNLIIGGLLLAPMYLAVAFFGRFMSLPAWGSADVRAFMALTFFSVLVDAVASAFGSVYFITNRLDLRSLQQLAVVLAKVGLFALLFFVFGPSLAIVGAAIALSTLLGAVIQIFVCQKLAGQVKLRLSAFSLSYALRLGASGFWYSVNRVASLMMCGGLLVVANAFFSPALLGLYALVFVAVNALSGVIMVLAAVFVPISAKCFARGEQKRLRDSLARDQKIVGFFAAVAVGVFIAFCDEFYALWLGYEPARLLILLSTVLITPVLSLACATPVINLGMVINRTKKLALVFLAGGLLTFATALGLASFGDFGAVGLALVSCVFQILWYSVAVPCFAARVLKCSVRYFLAPVSRTYFACLAVLALCLAANYACGVESWAELIVVGGAGAVFSVVVAFFVVFKRIRVKHS